MKRVGNQNQSITSGSVTSTLLKSLFVCLSCFFGVVSTQLAWPKRNTAWQFVCWNKTREFLVIVFATHKYGFPPRLPKCPLWFTSKRQSTKEKHEIHKYIHTYICIHARIHTYMQPSYAHANSMHANSPHKSYMHNANRVGASVDKLSLGKVLLSITHMCVRECV